MAGKKSSSKPKTGAADEKTVQKAGKTGNAAKSESACGWSWRRFWVYGAVWLCIFCAVSGGCRAVRWVNEKRQLIRLIFNGDFGGFELPVDPILPNGNGELAKWIRKNLPAEKTEERPAVAAVFSNVAGMLRRGELAGPRDAMAETIARLQPVCTRRVWLGFLTKLGTALSARLKDASAEEVAETFETVSDTIAGSAKAPPAPEPGFAITPGDGFAGPSASLDADSACLSDPEPGFAMIGGFSLESAPAEADEPCEETVPDTNTETEAEAERTAAVDCPTGSCPANAGGTRYGYGWYGRGWWY